MKMLVAVLLVITIAGSATLAYWTVKERDTLAARLDGMEKKVSGLGKTASRQQAVSQTETVSATPDFPVEPVETATSDLGARMAALEKKLGEVDARIAKVNADMAGLVSRAVAATGGASDDAATAGAKEKKKVDFGELFGEIIGESIRENAQAEKKKILKELVNPTVEGEAERQQNIDQSMEQLTNLLGLDEMEQKLMRDILDRSDKERRDAIGGIVASGREPTYEEVTKIIDDSYKLQDAQVTNMLTTDRYVKYERQQRTERRFVNAFVKMMFEPPESWE